MKSHELARKLLELPDVDVMIPQPQPGSLHYVEKIEEIEFCDETPKNYPIQHPACILTRSAYHLEVKRKYLESLK